MVETGEACEAYQAEHIKGVKCTRIEVDEIWSFVGRKEMHVPVTLRGKGIMGDAWAWVAIDPDSKLIPCWHVGNRDALTASTFIDDLKGRLATRVQLTSDGLKFYLQSVENSFGSEIDYAQLIKLYGRPGQTVGNEARYSPPVCIGARKKKRCGNPNMDFVSTSIVERQNLTMRMNIRRFTRLTNGYSKKMENHKAAIALHFMYYNFARIHHAHRVAPAMEAGLSDHIWSLEEIAALAV
jgi:IS1 family transposase